MKRIAITQSNYIPWRGYFDLIAAVDEFVLYDDMQFTKNDWRNRNRIKTPQGAQWLSIPVGQDISRRIRDVKLPSGNWREQHLRTLETNYRRAAHFAEVGALLAPLYADRSIDTLSGFNRDLLRAICGYLGISTQLSSSADYRLEQRSDAEIRTARLVGICKQAGASVYVSAPRARDYLCEEAFVQAGLSVVWFDYDDYPDYPQLWPPFDPQVSILDLMFNCGKTSTAYMKAGAR